MDLDRKMTRLLVVALTLLATGAAAQSTPYVGGTVGFHYQQFPFGSYRGDFAVAGTIPDFPLDPAALGQAVGGFHVATADSVTAVWYAAIAQSDTTVDAALLWVRRAGSSLPPGDYPIDAVGGTALFAYADDISDFAPPADPASAGLADWLSGIVAEHIFLALSGTVHVATVGPLGFTGTFSGLAADASPRVISVTAGTFALDGLDVAIEHLNWGDVKAAFR